MTKSQTWHLEKSSVFKNLCSKKHKYKTWHLEKSWDLVIFALIFSEFGYVPRKSLEHRKNLEHSQIQKKLRQKWLSPNFFLSVRFLHGQGYNLDRQKFRALVSDESQTTCSTHISIKRAIKSSIRNFGQNLLSLPSVLGC